MTSDQLTLARVANDQVIWPAAANGRGRHACERVPDVYLQSIEASKTAVHDS